ncbi:Gst Glutathione S-transferase [Burkholderiales bacterium]
MITLYTWPTPNGHKIQIMLEETGLAYNAVSVNIQTNEQFAPDFLKISPNNKIPAIVDSDGPDRKPYSVFESGAILVYLASKTGKFLGKTDRERFDVLQWVMFQMGGFGPMLGQAHHFRLYAPEKVAYGINRYTNEAKRLYGVINQSLSKSEFLGSSHYSIADIATWPWARSHEKQGVDLADYPNVLRWYEAIEKRPAVKRALALSSGQ